ncbi:MAG TPA: hypothetical protein VFL57_03215 [Bryobacteraceae bacterium]|nr:hypothetical protein [Bryobacteraceae bacterium]
MQPLDDDDLHALLRKWKAPAAPPALERRVLSARRESLLKRSLRWLATGTIRVPAPVGLAVVVAFVLLAALLVQDRSAPPVTTLAQFEPVRELKPRIIRSAYDAN